MAHVVINLGDPYEINAGSTQFRYWTGSRVQTPRTIPAELMDGDSAGELDQFWYAGGRIDLYTSADLSDEALGATGFLYLSDGTNGVWIAGPGSTATRIRGGSYQWTPTNGDAIFAIANSGATSFTLRISDEPAVSPVMLAGDFSIGAMGGPSGELSVFTPDPPMRLAADFGIGAMGGPDGALSIANTYIFLAADFGIGPLQGPAGVLTVQQPLTAMAAGAAAMSGPATWRWNPNRRIDDGFGGGTCRRFEIRRSGDALTFELRCTADLDADWLREEMGSLDLLLGDRAVSIPPPASPGAFTQDRTRNYVWTAWAGDQAVIDFLEWWADQSNKDDLILCWQRAPVSSGDFGLRFFLERNGRAGGWTERTKHLMRTPSVRLRRGGKGTAHADLLSVTGTASFTLRNATTGINGRPYTAGDAAARGFNIGTGVRFMLDMGDRGALIPLWTGHVESTDETIGANERHFVAVRCTDYFDRIARQGPPGVLIDDDLDSLTAAARRLAVNAGTRPRGWEEQV